MAEKTIAGKTISLNDEGYMTDASQWDRDVAKELAKDVKSQDDLSDSSVIRHVCS